MRSCADIVATNIVARNGVIHVIDAVIIPPLGDVVEAAMDAGATELTRALSDAMLVARRATAGRGRVHRGACFSCGGHRMIVYV